ncbi:hypothetical protein CFP65_1390 [Kitasatospora sp. MMS16-BH015]|uniref:hypothetical protein n=1 Tax=Kitasatospora sp. MMS16-BH015 TaxID=2018025 RepID=UPI000CA15B3E|nr:hypothetical protein [Kitasatospora sp. MMS16-BH015]AUG76289.1 hypothetical protein CFP65_1390 [Kitasatospora sp. MMS16-BH015]
MYELSRVLLRSVGPTAARYEDVLLDLSAAGAPVATTSATLFGEDEPVLRPSPASVLHLENGGGKSVLIKLIFSVVLPGHRQAVGATGAHTLSSFVLENDVSHIVLEWVHAKSGRHLVTGKVSAWRNGRPSKDLKQLTEWWYHFRPTETLGLRSLPIEENGRYRPLSDYCAQLSAAADADSALEYSCLRVQREWTERLADLGLDPELFRYQRAMNAEEGEAADAFSFGEHNAFVNSLLRAVLPPEPAEELTGVVGAYADKLAARGTLELERDFVSGALEHLVPLAEARRHCLTEATRRDESLARLDELLRLIQVRAHRENIHSATRRAESRSLAEAAKQETARHAHLTAVTTELHRQVADLRLAGAQTEEQKYRAELARVKLVENGWQAVPVALRHREAVAEDLRLREIVAATHEAARPALLARDTSALHFRTALTRLHDRTEQQAAEAEAAAAEQDGEAQQTQTRYNAAVGRAAQRTAEAAVQRAEIDSVRRELAAAVTEGRLGEDITAAEAANAAQAQAALAEGQVARLEVTLADLDEAHEAAGRTSALAAAAAATADEAYRTAEREFADATTRTAALAADPDLGGPTDPGQSVVDLDRDAGPLLDRLAGQRRGVAASQAALQVGMAADERARTALETTELLPPSLAAVRVQETLKEHGIDAWTGWEYLASLGIERRRRLVLQEPGLASGVIVNERFDEARELLRESGLWPTEHLAVGTAAQLLTESAEPTEDATYVVPVHPALYDERAADEERARLTERHHAHLREQAELHDLAERYATLHTRLTDWRRDFPPGRLGLLDATAQQRAAEAAEAARILAERVAEVEQLAEERRVATAALPPARLAHRAAERNAEALERLAEQEARIPGCERAERTALETAEAERQIAAEAAELGESHRALAAEHRRAADALRGTAQRMSAELDTIPMVEALPVGVEPSSDQPVEVLRRAFASAQEELRRVEVGEDLKAKAALADDRLKAAEQDLGDLAQEVRRQAEELLAGPETADAVSRALAREAATRAVANAEERLAESAAVASRRKAEFQAFPVPEEPVDLTPFTFPRHLVEGLSLLAEAEAARDDSDRLRLDLKHRSEVADRRKKEAADAARLFSDLSTILGAGAGAEPTAADPAFEGDAAAARERHDLVRSRFDEAAQALSDAQRAERTLTDQLVRHAVDDRFLELKLPNRAIIMATEPADLPAHAAQWTGMLRQRLRSLETDLDSIGRHRSAIIGQLGQQVREALRLVKRAESLSTLPAGMGDWSGKPFLRIAFTRAEDEALTDRLGSVVDEASAEAATGRAARRDGLSLVLRGVAAAVGTKGFDVQVLKPDSTLRDERVPVSEIKQIFSGGQVLTAAIVLYCTLAALRSSEQGRTRHRHSGVLFLDNPIGRASAGYLLQLQQLVASTLGVQLVYTTGLYDLTVLENFPLVVRLRNSADLGANRKYLTVEETIRPRLDNILPEQGGTIDSARYYRRPVEDLRDDV